MTRPARYCEYCMKRLSLLRFQSNYEDGRMCDRCHDERIEQERIEEAALASAANMGSPKFDRIVDDDANGRTLFYDGDHLSMIIGIPFDELDALMGAAVNKGVR